jgi:hypothetical protein
MSVFDKEWVFIDKMSDKGMELRCDDDSIFTVDDEEVVGCSEWMRCDRETFLYIINLHNKNIGVIE